MAGIGAIHWRLWRDRGPTRLFFSFSARASACFWFRRAVQELSDRGIGFHVLAGQGANIDSTTVDGRLVFGIFAALSEFERELIRERAIVGPAAARARGRHGGRRHALNKAQVRLAQAAMGKRETHVGDLCRELGITRATLNRYVGPKGELKAFGKRVWSG